MIAAPEAATALLAHAEGDLRAVGRIGVLEFAESEELEVRDVELEIAAEEARA